jgi:hypothetical protein
MPASAAAAAALRIVPASMTLIGASIGSRPIASSRLSSSIARRRSSG